MNFNTGSFNDKSPQILSSFVTDIQKSKEVTAIGTIKEMGGRNYIKTIEGWKYHGKGTGAKAQEHGESAGVAVKAEGGGGSRIPSMSDLTPTEKNYLAANFKHNSDEIRAAESEMTDNLQRKGVLEHLNGDRYKIHSNLLKPVKIQKEESMTDEDHLKSAQDKMSDYQDMVDTFLQVPNTNILVYGAGGTGKELSNDELIYTPSGVVTHGTIKVGDEVLTPSGRIAKVSGVFPQGVKDLYRVTLSDNTSVLAGSEHLWYVWDKTFYWDKLLKKRIYGGRFHVLSTKQLLDKGLKMRETTISSTGGTIWAENRFLIPYLPTPVDFIQKELPLNPYLLGYLLGDGWYDRSVLGVAIGKQDEKESLQNLSECIEEDVIIKETGKCSFSFYNCSSLRTALKDIGFEGKKSFNKFIPQEFLFTSIENRLELLRGLMDTDGTCEKGRGHCVYYTVSEQLAKDVQQLVLSFGKYASIVQQKRNYSGLAKSHRESKGVFDNVSEIYEVHFTMPQEEQYNPFKLERKAARWSARVGRPDIRGKAIVSIEFEKVGDATCIMIDDPEHLYITTNFITTHNTYNMVKSIGSQGLVKFEPGMEEGSDEYDVRIVSSKVTPAELYKILYLNRKKQIVFDDVTSIFESDDSLELLKHALDTGDDALVQWNSSKKIYHEIGNDPDDPDYVKIALPKAFKFTGQAAIITNKAADEFVNDPHLRALKTRCWSKNLTMSKKETAAMIGSILDHVNYKGLETFGDLTPEQTQQEKRDIFGLLKDNLDEISEDKLSMRAMRSLIAQKRILESKGKPWKEAVTRQLLEKGIWSEDLLKGFKILGINLNNDVIEKGGEGSRGGKIIGHTRSGKPIYEGKHESHKTFSKQDHLDAVGANRIKEGQTSGYNSKNIYKQEAEYHQDQADQYIDHEHKHSLNKGDSVKRAGSNESLKK